MKIFTTIVLLSTILAASTLSADDKDSQSTDYQASIMAFGVSQEAAKKAADAALQSIQSQKAASDNESEKVFATISDEILINPYGF